MEWMHDFGVGRYFRAATLILLLSAGQFGQASVVTLPLEWRAMNVELGLERLKREFLDDSISQDTEFVGAVLQYPDGQFKFTQGQGQPGQDRVTFRIQRPERAELVGLWHTHGAHGPARAVFSPTDAELVRQTGLPFYLIAPDGEIRVLRPEHLTERRARGRPGAPFKTGASFRTSAARLPRGSHPGERVHGRGPSIQAPRGCTDVMEV